ncbi:MAG: hypothetical protein M3083_22445, partial [Actinomycetota bacterium]|nr:hypothetical protein [Actinomycetota bacterium]
VPIGTGPATDDADEEPGLEPTGTEVAAVVPLRPGVPSRRRAAREWGGKADGTDGDDAGTPKHRPRRPSVAVARIAALVAAAPLVWAGLTSGVGVATAYGAGVAHPRNNSANVAYIGVRLDESQLTDPVIVKQLASLNATAVVDERTAANDPGAVQRLVSLGVDVENGGAGPRFDRQGHHVGLSPWTRANGDVAASHLLARIAGQPVHVFVPGRRLNAFDLMACYGAHSKTVVPNRILEPADDDPLQHVTARNTYLVNGARANHQQMESMLSQLSVRLAAANLSGAPLTGLA